MIDVVVCKSIVEDDVDVVDEDVVAVMMVVVIIVELVVDVVVCTGHSDTSETSEPSTH